MLHTKSQKYSTPKGTRFFYGKGTFWCCCYQHRLVWLTTAFSSFQRTSRCVFWCYLFVRLCFRVFVVLSFLFALLSGSGMQRLFNEGCFRSESSACILSRCMEVMYYQNRHPRERSCPVFRLLEPTHSHSVSSSTTCHASSRSSVGST